MQLASAREELTAKLLRYGRWKGDSWSTLFAMLSEANGEIGASFASKTDHVTG